VQERRRQQRIETNEVAYIFGDGSSSRDFCYVDNIVQANLLAATSPSETSGTVYNCGCNGRTDGPGAVSSAAGSSAAVCERVDGGLLLGTRSMCSCLVRARRTRSAPHEVQVD